MRNEIKHLKKKIAKVQQRKQRPKWIDVKISQRKKLAQYGKALSFRVDGAQYLPRAAMEGGNWQPKANMCHQNVTEFCEFDPSFKPVRGWLFFDMSASGYHKFVAHSVLKFPTGEIMDITPSNAMAEYPFIHSELSNLEYAATVMVCESGELNVPLQNA